MDTGTLIQVVVSLASMLASGAAFVVNLQIKADISRLKLEVFEKIETERKENHKLYADIDIEERVRHLERKHA